MTNLEHVSVLLDEAVQALLMPEAQASSRADSGTGACYVDATFGRGGHSRYLLSKMGQQDRLIAFDKDPQAVAEAAQIHDARFSIRHQSFVGLEELPAGSVMGVLMDLGVSSPQIDDPQRGFSFRFNGPLDMRMDCTRGRSVAQWLEHAQVDEIAEVIREYGEERFAVQIAKAIVARRENQGAITSTAELAQLVAGAVKTREPGQDPATRTFQAFRIFINNELEDLEQALETCLRVLAPGGRLVVISFHSLEDRIVKQFIVRHSRQTYDRRVPFAPEQAVKLQALGRQRPSAQEVQRNARARSAVMRVAVRTEVPCSS